MGLADRDYNREPQQGRPADAVGLRMGSVTAWLIGINIVAFLFERTNGAWLYRFGYFSVDAAIRHGQLWRFITFQFLHANVNHIFFNMLSLYFFGPLIEEYLGPRRYLAFYLLCGVAGPLCYILLWAAGVLQETEYTHMVGASAGIFGVLIAAARVAPDATVMLLFPPIPMKLKLLAWILIGLSVWTVFSSGHNAGGEAAHLGGAAVGWLLIGNPRLLDFATLGARRRGPFIRR